MGSQPPISPYPFSGAPLGGTPGSFRRRYDRTRTPEGHTGPRRSPSRHGSRSPVADPAARERERERSHEPGNTRAQSQYEVRSGFVMTTDEQIRRLSDQVQRHEHLYNQMNTRCNMLEEANISITRSLEECRRNVDTCQTAIAATNSKYDDLQSRMISLKPKRL